MEGEERRIAAESCPQCGGPLPFSYGTRLTCRYCGASLVRLAGPGREEGAEGASAHGADEAWAVRLKRAVCMDPKFGVGVFHWMVPADWEFEGTVWWRDSVTMPAVIPFHAWNPEGPEQIECFPSLPHVWGENPVTKAMGKWAPKQYYFKQDGLEQRPGRIHRDRQHAVRSQRRPDVGHPGLADAPGQKVAFNAESPS